MNEIFVSIVSMFGLGVFFAIILAIADRTMGVKEDSKVSLIEKTLPGLNCGACGYAGCYSFAVALSKNEVLPTGCLPGGEEVATKLAEILGVKKTKTIKNVAVLHCNADFDRRKKLADYRGIKTCQAANAIVGGGVACRYGCLGFGDCARICPFGAIKMANGLPIVDTTRCTGCGKCVSICPRNLYSIEKLINDEIVIVACKSQDSGATVKEVCGVGCIGCRLCQKLTDGVFEVKNNLAEVHYEKSKPDTDWNKAIEKCPTKVIVKIV